MQSGGMKIFSIFTSINGEVCQPHQGSLCTFIRFAGCNLRCKWCDTEYAQNAKDGWEAITLGLYSMVKENGYQNVTITGGEPMMQKEGLDALCIKLMQGGYNISIETNGSYDFDPLFGISYVVDFKLPSSRYFDQMDLDKPFMKLGYQDWIKFVISDYTDYKVAKEIIKKLKRKLCQAKCAMSPILTSVSADSLLQWLKRDRISDVVISVQLHKLLKLNESL